MSKKWLQDEVASRKLSDYFTFEGLKPVSEIPKYQTIADSMIVCLSKSDLFEYGIPAKVNSYLAGGRPILAAMDGEGQRLINNYSKSGICVNAEDSKALADAIMRMHDFAPSTRQKMGENGRKYHDKHFEREYNLDRLEKFMIYEKRIIDKEYKD
jgi:glycosyltransferase involved in cell wall biosynthesis